MASDYHDALNLGTEELVTVDQLVDLVCAVAGKQLSKRHNLEGPQGVRGRNSDNSRLREVLGWEPSLTLRQGLMRTYPWIEAELRKAGRNLRGGKNSLLRLSMRNVCPLGRIEHLAPACRIAWTVFKLISILDRQTCNSHTKLAIAYPSSLKLVKANSVVLARRCSFRMAPHLAKIPKLPLVATVRHSQNLACRLMKGDICQYKSRARLEGCVPNEDSART